MTVRSYVGGANGKLFLIQCNLDLVTLSVSAKTVTKSQNVTKSNAFMYVVNGKMVIVK